MCDSPRKGCAWRITPICMWREQAIILWSRWSDLGEWPLIMLVKLVNSWLHFLIVTTRVISSSGLHCCLLPQCEALRTCRSCFPIATTDIHIIRINYQFLTFFCVLASGALQLSFFSLDWTSRYATAETRGMNSYFVQGLEYRRRLGH